ncbi:hypothetical protein GCM10020358_34520 [Amorphoplanes nipponensis]
MSRQIDGWRHAPLGLLWREVLHGGIAVHGATSCRRNPRLARVRPAFHRGVNHLWTSGELPIAPGLGLLTVSRRSG